MKDWYNPKENKYSKKQIELWMSQCSKVTRIENEKEDKKFGLSNYPFGQQNDRPNYYYTQDIFSDGQGITGYMKKRKKSKNARIRKIKKTT